MPRTRSGKTQSQRAKDRPTAAKRRALKKRGESQIDAFLRQVGVKDPSECTDPEGWRKLNLDSACGFAFVDDEDGYVAFRVIAEIMPLPSDKDLVVPLMRDLLECNSLILGGCRFCIALGSVYATAGELVESMKDEDYADHIHGVMTMVRVSAGELMKKYGGTRKKRPARSVSA